MFSFLRPTRNDFLFANSYAHITSVPRKHKICIARWHTTLFLGKLPTFFWNFRVFFFFFYHSTLGSGETRHLQHPSIFLILLPSIPERFHNSYCHLSLWQQCRENCLHVFIFTQWIFPEYLVSLARAQFLKMRKFFCNHTPKINECPLLCLHRSKCCLTKVSGNYRK